MPAKWIQELVTEEDRDVDGFTLVDVRIGGIRVAKGLSFREAEDFAGELRLEINSAYQKQRTARRGT